MPGESPRSSAPASPRACTSYRTGNPPLQLLPAVRREQAQPRRPRFAARGAPLGRGRRAGGAPRTLLHRDGDARARRAEPGRQLALPEAEEPLLVAADLVDAGVRVTGTLGLADALDPGVGVGTANDVPCDRVLVDRRQRRLEMRRRRELGEERIGQRRERPHLARGAPRRTLVAGPAAADLDMARPVLAAGRPVVLDQVGVGLRGDHRVAGARRELRRAGPARSNHDRRRLVGQREQLRVLHDVVRAAVVADAAPPQQPDHGDRLLEHLETRAARRPACADDVLVQILPGAEPEHEASRQQGRGRRGRLRDDRGVDADRRARDRRADDDAARRLRDRAKGGPRERTLPLPRRPRVEVVRQQREGEPGLLGTRGERGELGRAELLGGELVPDLDHRRPSGRGISAPRRCRCARTARRSTTARTPQEPTRSAPATRKAAGVR